jgi:predicted methyltransferase
LVLFTGETNLMLTHGAARNVRRVRDWIGPALVSLLLVVMAETMLWAQAPPAATATPAAAIQSGAASDAQQAEQSAPQRPADRPAAIRALAARLEIGPGKAVADIGAGKGEDTWVFAEIVGPSGMVYSEEITEDLVKSLKKGIEERKLTQVRAVLGRADSPTLPATSVDVAYMRLVYHHFSQPREMLREIWRALKPGGLLVVVDCVPGTLRDWVPLEQRASKHTWTAETTVVREASEEGFQFVACADELSEAKEKPFVLIFQRPENQAAPGLSADPLLPLPIHEVADSLLPADRPLQRPAIIALGQARELIPAILQRSAGAGVEIVLEEWATQKDERPPLPEGVSLPAVLTNLGDPQLGPEPIDAVFFLDTYHLLFHGTTLLAKLHERLTPDGRIYVLDRTATEPLSRRYASHRRQIDPQTVVQELTAAGFTLQAELPHPAADRFLLVFSKSRSE